MPTDPPPVESSTPVADAGPEVPATPSPTPTKDKPVVLRVTDPFVDALRMDVDGTPITVLAEGTAMTKKQAEAVLAAAERDGFGVAEIKEG